MKIEYYPLALVSEQFEKISFSKPVIPSKPIEPVKNSPQLPVKPFHLQEKEKEANESFLSIASMILGAVLFNGMLISFAIKGQTWIWIFYGILVLGLFFIFLKPDHDDPDVKLRKSREDSYHREMKEYNLRIEESEKNYLSDLKKYKELLHEHNSTVELIESPSAISKFRADKKLRYLSGALRPQLTQGLYNEGITEKWFYQFLKRYFGNYISNGLVLKDIDWYGDAIRPYKPDFVFRIAETIYIDIEIDEPYMLHNCEPIHYVGSDVVRDGFFIENQWIVIRFAEEQIVKEPENCCYFIAEKIFEFIENDSFIKNMSTFQNPKPIKRWTEDEARVMAINRFRTSYLKKHLEQNPITIEHDVYEMIAGEKRFNNFLAAPDYFDETPVIKTENQSSNVFRGRKTIKLSNETIPKISVALPNSGYDNEFSSIKNIKNEANMSKSMLISRLIESLQNPTAEVIRSLRNSENLITGILTALSQRSSKNH